MNNPSAKRRNPDSPLFEIWITFLVAIGLTVAVGISVLAVAMKYLWS